MGSEGTTMNEMQTVLPIYQKSIDWNAFFAEYPVPDVYERTVYKWPREKIRALLALYPRL